MSSDADYAAFLDKANQDTSAPKATTQSQKKSMVTRAVDTEIPASLEKVEEYFVSDADEPFEPVSLKWHKGVLPSLNDFSALIGQKATEITQKEFDPKGQYDKVLDAVKQAGNGDLMFCRVELEGTRVEYFVISVDKSKKTLVGMKALAIES